MNVQSLIQAHRIVANWQMTSPQADVENAYSMTFLSMGPTVSRSELMKRHLALSAIRDRQLARVVAVETKLLAAGANAEDLNEIRTVVSEAACSSALMFSLAHLLERDSF